MKTERRHELQTNELADWLGEHAKQYMPYAKTGIGIAVLIVAGLFALNVMRGQREGQRIGSWNEYFNAVQFTDLEGLRSIADRYQGTEAAAWALQSVGDIESATAARVLLAQPAEAKNRLESARDAYLQAIQASRDPMLLPRAHMGLAQVYESLNDFDNAKKEYETVINKWGSTSLAEEAADRLALVNMPSTKEFYDWFLQQKPRTPPAAPDSGLNLTPPTTTDDLPRDPDLSLPAEGDLVKPIDEGMQPPETARESDFESALPSTAPDTSEGVNAPPSAAANTKSDDAETAHSSDLDFGDESAAGEPAP